MWAAAAETYTLAGAFLLGASVATLATLRIVRFVTDYFAGVERRRLDMRRADDDADVNRR